jgi:orotate phosphoribosyltransferase
VGESDPRAVLLEELRAHALVIGEVTLSSGQTASYYVDARRALLQPRGFRAVGELIADAASRLGAQAVGGPVMAAIPLACAAIAVPEGDELEGPVQPGTRCLVVEDTVTTGGSVVHAIERMREEGLEIAGGLCVVDRLAGGAEAIEAAGGTPFRAMVTIDELYPDRPDR